MRRERFFLGVDGNHDYGQAFQVGIVAVFQFARQFKAGFARHLLVEENYIYFETVEQFDGFRGRCGFAGVFHTDLIQGGFDECPREFVVIDDQTG